MSHSRTRCSACSIPGIKLASVTVPTEPLDDYEEAQVENALARFVWTGTHYKLVGASDSAKKGKFHFVDREHSRAIAERFEHWPQAAIVYFGILVSPCKVMMEESDARVLVVPDRKLGTKDCRGWIWRSVFRRLQQKHDDEILSYQIERLRRAETQAKGADDTAALRKAIAQYGTIYLPAGQYRVTDTISLKPHTVLIGLHPSVTRILIADSTPDFQGVGSPKPLLETPPNGTNIVTGIGLYTNGINPRAVAAKWMAGRDSMMNDVRFLGGHGTIDPNASAEDSGKVWREIYNNTHTADSNLRRWDGQYPSLWITGGGTFVNIYAVQRRPPGKTRIWLFQYLWRSR